MRIPAFQHAEAAGIRLHVLPTDRFKTYSVSLYIGSPLTERTVTPHALIPFVLRRGNRAYPLTVQFREKLDALYGAGFGFDVYKRGNNQMIQFRMDTVSDRYVASEGQTLLRETLEFLLATICDPALIDGRFNEQYVNAEKETVAKRLQAIVNDKIRYAAERCTQEMYANDPFRFNALGTTAALAAIDAATLTDAYRAWLAGAQIDLYVVGDTSLAAVQAIVERMWISERGAPEPYRFAVDEGETRSEPQRIVDRLDVNQGKLNIGCRLPVLYRDDDYPAALMYNGILGGYPHAKLFTNVREKASLAYYASSRYDGFKGSLMIQSGIEVANYERAVAIMEEQIASLAAGHISDLEWEQTKAMIVNQLQEIVDSAYEMIAFDFNNVLFGSDRTITGLIDRISELDRAAVERVAQKLKLDTIYFLRNTKGDGA